jgi:hypothetical protein
LSGTPNHGLQFKEGNYRDAIGYSDADFTRDIDKRKSTTGYIFLYCWGPVFWASRRQRCTALSTTEAEYIAGCEASKEAVWISRLLKEIGLVEPPPFPYLATTRAPSV